MIKGKLQEREHEIVYLKQNYEEDKKQFEQKIEDKSKELLSRVALQNLTKL
jgi:hypothetical protein